jgi:hypothetical protein
MLFLCFLLSLNLSTRDITEFNQLALRTGMVFIQPAGWDEVPVMKNSQMNYDYAIKLNGKDIEIRYRIQPLDDMVKKYQEWLKNKPPGSMMIDPNNLYSGMVMATAANIGGKMPADGKSFPPDAVKRDFGADKGGVIMIVPVKEFGQNYKYCFMLTLQKADKSVAYVFFMANSQDDLNTSLPATFTALKYKE